MFGLFKKNKEENKYVCLSCSEVFTSVYLNDNDVLKCPFCKSIKIHRRK